MSERQYAGVISEHQGSHRFFAVAVIGGPRNANRGHQSRSEATQEGHVQTGLQSIGEALTALRTVAAFSNSPHSCRARAGLRPGTVCRATPRKKRPA